MLFLPLVSGCSPAQLLNDTVSREGYTVERNIPYGPFSRLKLDCYRPFRPRANGKAVLFLYGGSWESGNKDDYLFVGQSLASRGITTVIPDYRLYPEASFPAFIEDCAQATRWTADRLGASKLHVMGHSAGAHIALMLAAKTSYLAAAGVDRMSLRAVIGLSGPYDFLPLKSQRLINIFHSSNDPSVEPITFARAPLPPVLLIHGAADTTVLPANSEHLAAAWRRAHAQAELKIYSGVGHIDVVAAFASILRNRAATLTDVLAYIQSS